MAECESSLMVFCGLGGDQASTSAAPPERTYLRPEESADFLLGPACYRQSIAGCHRRPGIVRSLESTNGLLEDGRRRRPSLVHRAPEARSQNSYTGSSFRLGGTCFTVKSRGQSEHGDYQGPYHQPFRHSWARRADGIAAGNGAVSQSKPKAATTHMGLEEPSSSVAFDLWCFLEDMADVRKICSSSVASVHCGRDQPVGSFCDHTDRDWPLATED